MPSYKNGNYIVTILSDGTKIRRTEDNEFIPSFSENVDCKLTDKCREMCNFCLVPNTKITTSNGLKNVQDITTDDLVYSFNTNTKNTELKNVIETYERDYDGELIEIKTDNHTIRCTPNHKIFTTNRGFVRADEISIEDDILINVKIMTKIKDINRIKYTGKVYNFAVKDNNNYYANNILVHNCYEGCTPEGKHGDLFSYPFINTLHPYTEIALNGNDLDHPDLVAFLEFLKKKKVYANITVNQNQFLRNYDKLKTWSEHKYVYGIGVSLIHPTDELIEKMNSIPNTVLHTIVGILKESDIQKLRDHDLKVLLLGYKDLQRGINYHKQHNEFIKNNTKYLFDNLDEIKTYFKVLSFDNLAIEQLKVQRILSSEEWDEFYMGDDGGYTFYIDMVKGEFAKNSISKERFPIGDKTMDEMFHFIQNKYNKK